MLLVSDTGKSLDFSAAWTMSAHDKSITHQDFVIWIWGLIVCFFLPDQHLHAGSACYQMRLN